MFKKIVLCKKHSHINPTFVRFARLFIGCILAIVGTVAIATEIDHSYKQYDALLNKHVNWLPNGKASVVNYQALQQDRDTLKTILNNWSALTQAEFDALNKKDQMAFLINAYNGFTLELILTEYPNLDSIKDLGSLFSSPWKKEFFTLLGKKRHLDWIEHEMLRPNYSDPRIHAAVNCASIGCPALNKRAFVGHKLDQQLEQGMQRFLADNSRNRVENSELKVSKIFDWFTEDFEKGFRGTNTLKGFLALYAEQLSSNPEVQAQIKGKKLNVSYLDYDWGLNVLN